jgi:HEAT repeat protein
MGLFDLFKGGGAKGEKKGDKKSNAAAKWAERAGDKRAQNYDRQEAIQALAEMGTPEAAAALLKRFTFIIDPSITDQEEKDLAFRGVLRAGKDAVEPVRAFAAKAESLAWPMRILKELLDDEEFVDELVLWLSKWDTEYSKFIDPKIQLLVALEEHTNAKVRPAVERFLEDVSEPARFHAVATLLAQGDAEVLAPLVKLMEEEESVRVKNKIADGVTQREWKVPEELRETMRKVLPYAFSIDGDGRMKKRDVG